MLSLGEIRLCCPASFFCWLVWYSRRHSLASGRIIGAQWLVRKLLSTCALSYIATSTIIAQFLSGQPHRRPVEPPHERCDARTRCCHQYAHGLCLQYLYG